MASYNTKQKNILLGWLTAHADNSFTIEDLSEKLSDGDGCPGKSTVYRLVNRLVDDGVVKRFVKGNSRHFYYQLAGSDCKCHLHMKCTMCGALLHMSHEESEAIMETVLGKDLFTIDSSSTTLFGVCAGCSGKAPRVKAAGI